MAKTNNNKTTGLLNTDRRLSTRYPINFPLRYKVAGMSNGGELHSRTLNISKGGLLLASKQPAKELSNISIKIPFQNKIFSVKGKVVHCRYSLAKRVYEIGISFYTVSDEFKVKLIEQLYLIDEFKDVRSRELGKKISMEDAAKEWIRRYSKNFRSLYG